MNFYIPPTIIEWNKLDQDKRNAESYALFGKHLLRFVRPETNNIFNVHNAKGIKPDYELVLFTSRNTNFVDVLNPLFNCGNFVD